MVFDSYSRYYDLLYRDKDYAGEAAYVASQLARHNLPAGRVLELGCGTGAHAEHLARMGYAVHGVDQSQSMLARATARKLGLPDDIGARLSFARGDVRTVRTGAAYEAVISLFHVMSYQTTNADLQAAFVTAAAHLRPGGVFVFDFWYGPAVLTQKPEVRVKRLGSDDVEVIRIAEPDMEPSSNVVTVNYSVLVREKPSERTEQFAEAHRMRYLFLPELELMLRAAGLRQVLAQEWLTARPLSFDTWSAMVVAQL